MFWGCTIRKPRVNWRRSRGITSAAGRRAHWPLLLLALCLPVHAAQPWTQACESAPPEGLAAPEARSTLVLIIDDLGYQWGNGMAMVNLPGKLNLAVLPHTPHGQRLAEAGFAAGKEIMLHVPMSNRAGEPMEADALSPNLDREAFDATLHTALEAIPHVRGVNNHMGSELTELPIQMGWLMQAPCCGVTCISWTPGPVPLRWLPAPPRTSACPTCPGPCSWTMSAAWRRSITSSGGCLSEPSRRVLPWASGTPTRKRPTTCGISIPRLRCRGIRLALVSEVLAEQQAPEAAPEENRYDPASEPDFDAVFGHVSLGLGNRVLAEVEDAGSQHRVGTSEGNALHEVIEVTHSP